MVLLRATVSTISIGHDRRRYFCREEVLILCKKKKKMLERLQIVDFFFLTTRIRPEGLYRRSTRLI